MKDKWIRFDEQEPEDLQFIVAIRSLDSYEDPSQFESDLAWNAVGHWRNGEVWQGDDDLNGFTHWLPLPERPKRLENNT